MTSPPEKDLTPPDSARQVLREVLKLAYPIMMGYASTTLMYFVDALMVGRLGKTELAAVSTSGVIVFTVIALASGVASCVNTFASQSLGRNRPQDCAAYAWQNAYFAAGSGLLALAFVPTLPWLFAWIGHSPALQTCEVSYGRIRLGGMGFMVAAWGFCSYFQGVHRPWVATITTLAVNVVNVVANYALIFGHWGFPRMGVAGAAWATIIAAALQCVMLVAVILHPWHARTFGGWDACRFDWAKLKQLVHIGWPAGINFFLDIASWAIFTNFFMGQFGEDAIAGNMVAMQYMHLSFMPAVGLSHATAALVGRYLGQQDVPRAKQRAYAALRLALGYMLFMGVMFYLFRYPMVRLFNTDPGVVEVAATILIFAAVFQGFDAFGIVSSGALRGAGDTHWTAAATVLLCWFVFVPGAWFFAYKMPQLGAKGPWFACTAYICLLGTTLFIRFKSERWSKIDIFGGKTEA